MNHESPCRRSLHCRANALVGALVLSTLVWLGQAAGQQFELGIAGTGTALVTDPAASAQEAVAMQVGDEGEGRLIRWTLAKTPLKPGYYRVELRLRLHFPADLDLARVQLRWALPGEGAPLAEWPLKWTLFNSQPGEYTVFTREFSLPAASVPRLEAQWKIAPLPPGEKPRPARPLKRPTVAAPTADLAPDAPPDDAGADEFATSVRSESAVPLSAIDYPAVLADSVTFTCLSDSVAITRVWPEKVHVYPGEENPVTVTVRNYGLTPVATTVRLVVRTGLDEAGPPLEAPLTVPAQATAEHRFAWRAGPREYGHEARAEVSVGGRVVHAATEYFSVSAPVWKTALQGSGFLTWYGREKQFPAHVAENRRHYINVEEAFSWQPSSWTDLNPTTEDWWSGQNNFHNSMQGLRQWLALSHAEGIKMITYSWPTGSGPQGLEWARRYPELATHVEVGLAASTDPEDLGLYEVTHARPELWRYQNGVWHNVGVDLGRLGSIVMGADQLIASARQFGWDGVRFDMPPGWSAMSAEGVHWEFAEFGVKDLMAKLLPEYYGITTGAWDGTAISARNIRYLRHRLLTEAGPTFAIGYNFMADTGPDSRPRGDVRFFAECCRQGGQMMDEAIRMSGSWAHYREEVRAQAEIARQHGGYQTVVSLNAVVQNAYAAIFTFAAGSHPYLDYGWGSPLPGHYPRFMTRYGEYCWDLALTPVPAAAAGLTVTPGEGLLWQDYLRSRPGPGGSVQTVVHLITPPTDDAIAPKQGRAVAPWRRQVVVRKRAAKEPVVWRLSAEPDVQGERLAVRADGDGFAVTVPEHRLWTVLVWEERP